MGIKVDTLFYNKYNIAVCNVLFFLEKSKNTINSYPANASTFFLILAFRIKKTTPIDNIHNKNVL